MATVTRPLANSIEHGSLLPRRSSGRGTSAALRLVVIPLSIVGIGVQPVFGQSAAAERTNVQNDAPVSEFQDNQGPPRDARRGQPADSRNKARERLDQSLRDNWIVEPRISLKETWTDNIRLQPSGDAKSDWITELVPGLAIRGKQARLEVNLDYGLTGLLSARDSNRNDFQNNLNAFGSLEAIEKLLFVEARANISQQTISAFGVQSSSNISDTTNRAETRVFSLSPYLVGPISTWASYQLRLLASSTQTKGGLIGDSNARTWTGRVESTTNLARFGWSVDFKNTRDNLKDRDDTKSQLARGTLVYHLSPQLRFFGRAGREANNYFNEDRSGTTHGFGLAWTPDQRTHVELENDKRLFGRSYRYAFQHRTPLSAWSLIASQDLSTTTDQLTRSPESSAFQRLFDVLSTEFPDPVRRGEQVRQQLLAAGIPFESLARAGFLTTQVFVDKRVEASVALIGARNTVALAGLRTQSRPVAPQIGSSDDFALAETITGTSVNFDWSHKLSALSSLKAGAAWARNTGIGATDARRTVQRTITLVFNTQLSPKTSGSLGLRHVRFDPNGVSSTPEYREKALFATIDRKF